MSNKHENRIGRFSIAMNFLRFWEELIPMMGNFVVLKADYRADMDRIEYLAYSPVFDVVEEYVAAPWYEIEITLDGFNPATVKATREKVCHGCYRPLTEVKKP